MKAHHFLDQVGFVLDKRIKEYGEPRDNFDEIAKKWSLTLNHPITPFEVGLLMIDLKMVRLKNDPSSFDSLLDIAGYAACLAEVQNLNTQFQKPFLNNIKLLEKEY